MVIFDFISVATTRCQYWLRVVGPLVNKFEQVNSDDHQMLVAGGVAGIGGIGPISGVWYKGV